MSLDRDRRAKTLKMTHGRLVGQERLATELVHKHGLKELLEGRTKSVPISIPIRLVQAEEDQLPSSSNKSVKKKFAGSGLKY